MRGCGQHLNGSEVEVKLESETAHYAGVRMCGKVWSCPVCGPKIRQHRAHEIAEALGRADEAGRGLVFVTFTASHTADVRLAYLYGAQERAWKRMQQSRRWRDWAAALGIKGFVCFREVTWGEASGWHPHRHVAFVLERPVGEGRLWQWEAAIARAWVDALEAEGLTASAARGVRADVVRSGAASIGLYAGKVAQEMARGDLKAGRGAERFTVEELLDLVEVTGDAVAADRWQEYELATEGRRMMSWSRGLRRALLPSVELTDEEVAELEVGGTTVATVNAAGWGALRARAALGDVLVATETSFDALRECLAEYCPPGSWRVVEQLPMRWPTRPPSVRAVWL